MHQHSTARDNLENAMTYFQAEMNKAQEAIERVRELHKPILGEFENEPITYCSECTNLASKMKGHLVMVSYGYCKTVKALDEPNDQD